MRALFLTTQTVDCENHVQAWDSFAPKAVHLTFDHRAICNDHLLLAAAVRIQPDVIFYIGANQACGNPRPNVLRSIRAVAPLIHLCSDATDRPWHPVLAAYKTRECFDLQVAIDGARNAPGIDMTTLTPVDHGPFAGNERRDIRGGFSGTVGRWNARSEVVNALKWFGGLTVRERLPEHGYRDHARFLKRCRMVLNLSFTGTQHAHHIKGRVIESGWAGCALMEYQDSPIGDWFPPDCWIPWVDPLDAAGIIKNTSDSKVEQTAQRLALHVRTHYSAARIYGEMLERVGLPQSVAAA